ncbi:MAG: SDR family NAD(P)-dependent oxidoreductase, partial [Candidatus Zixiibacteriota bacterium]
SLVSPLTIPYVSPMSEAKPSILITGANGFVGARLCRKFQCEGFHVIAGVRQTSDLSLLNGLELEYRYGDVTQPETLPDMVAGVEYVIHNAGITKTKRKEAFFEVNEKGTAALFDTVAKHNPSVKRVVLISSLAAAGPSQPGRPLTEQDEPHPITAYGRSKLAAEGVALSFADRVPVVILRPSGIYGPGDKEILSFFQTVNRRIKPYIGKTDRCLQLIHVDDLAEAVYLAVTQPTESGSILFIAESRSYTMRELIATLELTSSKRAFPVHIPSPLFRGIALLSEAVSRLFGGTPMLTREKARELLDWWEVSTEKAKQELGFQARISFEQGARETFRWYREKGWLK